MTAILDRAKAQMEREIAEATARYEKIRDQEAAKPPALFASKSGLEVFEADGGYRIRVAMNGYVTYGLFATIAEAKAEIRQMDREAAAERRWEKRVS